MDAIRSFAIETPDVFARVRALRFERAETGEQFGAAIGLHKSKVSELESGRLTWTVTVPVALMIEELSVRDGVPRIDAAELSEQVRAARARCTAGCAQADEVAARG
jgi:transcriptional regulator with XRE-family HTH domain